MVALYLRLSSADGDLGKDGKDESNSIEHQRAILRDFVRRKDDVRGEIQEYVDDGYSGTNFNRPAFQSMLEDMKTGKIDTVLTKDLSRLGRNYIEVGDYMEQIFPMLGVRYIAVNSNYDSKEYIGSTSGIDMSFMNLVNSLYSKDLSKKYRTAVETRWRNGKSTCGRMPLGYIGDPDNRGEWIIEPVGCEIIRKIYGLVNDGLKVSEIIDRLNDEHVPTPGQYREKMGHVKRQSRKVSDEEWLWDRRMLRQILHNYEYTGALIQSKMKTIVVGSGRRRTVPDEERFVTENHHEPIVSMDEYEKGKALFKSAKKGAVVYHDKYPLGNVIYCANCGLSMEYNERAAGAYMKCRHKELVGSASSCPETKYPTDMIDAAVISSLRTQLFEMEMLRMKLKPSNKAADDGWIKMIDEDLRKFQADKTRAYERYAEGKLSKEEYLEARDRIKNKIQTLEKKKAKTLEPQNARTKMCDTAEIYIALRDELIIGKKISQELIDAFIEKVYIHDAYHIEVIFKFTGLIEQMLAETGKEKTA